MVVGVVDQGCGVVRVELEGDVEGRWQEVRDGLVAAATSGTATLVLDLHAVTFFNSSGVNGLLAARAELEGEGVELRLGPLSPIVERVLDLTQLLVVLPRGPAVPGSASTDPGYGLGDGRWSRTRAGPRGHG